MDQKAMEKLLNLRGRLGHWHNGSASITILETTNILYGTSKPFNIVEQRQSFSKLFEYQTDLKSAFAKVMWLSEQPNYKIINYQYPELQKYFNERGELITSAVIFRDAISVEKLEQKYFKHGLDVLDELFS